MKRKKILYLFRRPVKREIKSSNEGNYPHDFFYGFTKISKTFSLEVTDKVFKYKIISAIDQILIKILYSKIKTGVSFFSVLFLIPEIKKSDLIFSTVDSYGLPYALYKYIKITDVPFIFNTIGLCDTLLESKSKLFRKIAKKIMEKSDKIISGASNYECKKLARLLDLPQTKFSFIPFGIDTNYFRPSKKVASKNQYILIIGADPKRDWDLYFKVISALDKIQFIIITNRKIFEHTPKNAQVYYNLPIDEVRKYIWNSYIVLILSKQNYHFAGQSTILRAMSCAKPVLFTKSYGTEEYGFKNFKNAILAKPNDLDDVIKSLKKIYKNKAKLNSIGEQARKLIVEEYNIDSYSKDLTEVFKETLRNNQ